MLCGACVALLAAGCGGARQDAHEPRGDFTVRVVKASFLPISPSPDRPASNCECKTPAPRPCRTSRSRSTPSTTPKTTRTGHQQAPDLGHRRGSRADPQAPRPNPGGQPTGRWPDGLRQHLGARPARARTHANVPLEGHSGEARSAHRPFHGRGGPRRQARAQLADGALPTGHFTVDVAPSHRPTTSIPKPARSSGRLPARP